MKLRRELHRWGIRFPLVPFTSRYPLAEAAQVSPVPLQLCCSNLGKPPSHVVPCLCSAPS